MSDNLIERAFKRQKKLERRAFSGWLTLIVWPAGQAVAYL